MKENKKVNTTAENKTSEIEKKEGSTMNANENKKANAPENTKENAVELSYSELLTEALKTYNDLIDNDKALFELVSKAHDELEEALDNRNKELVKLEVLKLHALYHTNPSEMFKAYLTNPYIKVLKLAAIKDSKRLEVEERPMILSFPVLDSALSDGKTSIARNGSWSRRLEVYRFNIAKAEEEDYKMGKGQTPAVLVDITEAIRADRKEFAMDQGYSNGKFENYLNAIVADILPEGMELKMHVADVRYIRKSCTKTTNGKTRVSHLKTFMDNLVLAMHYRYTGKQYSVEFKASRNK